MMASAAAAQPAPGADATAVLAALLAARTGQQLGANRAWRIETALKSLLRERGLETVDQLVVEILDGQNGRVADRAVDALLNQETSFFRDAPVFASVIEALDAMAGGAAGGAPRRQRIWCAGCAFGQEPYSLAMQLAEGRAAGELPEILATDVSEAALVRARSGRYNQFEIQRGLPVQRMIRWFEGEGDEWTARTELTRLVTFRRQNLVTDRAPGGPFDLVLCRNVLFYLAPELRTKVLNAIADVLRPGGLLVLGAGETVLGQTDRFEPSRRFRGFYEVAGQARLAG